MKSEKEHQWPLFFISSLSSLKMRDSKKKEKTERNIVYTNEELKNMKNRERYRVIVIDFADFILTSFDFSSIGSI